MSPYSSLLSHLSLVLCTTLCTISCTSRETTSTPPAPQSQDAGKTSSPVPETAPTNREDETVTPPVSNSEAQQSRPNFTTAKIKIGSKSIKVEVADNDEERSFGLMYVEKMEPDSGMLFIFDETRHLSFWMRNTRIPLSIAYINEKKKIIDILDMVPASDLDMTPKTYPSSAPAKYALEMNVGWFSANKIKVGDTLEIF